MRTLICTALLALAFGSAQAADQMSKHAERGVACTTCHKGDFKAPFDRRLHGLSQPRRPREGHRIDELRSGS